MLCALKCDSCGDFSKVGAGFYVESYVDSVDQTRGKSARNRSKAQCRERMTESRSFRDKFKRGKISVVLKAS